MQKVYCIKDINGRFNGHINICSNSMTKRNADWKWDYYSNEVPMGVNLGREDVELKIQKLRELNSLAKFDLTWEVVKMTDSQWDQMVGECHQKYMALGKDHMLVSHYISSIVMKDIEKGCIGAHRKLVRDIYRHYKGDEYIVEQLI